MAAAAPAATAGDPPSPAKGKKKLIIILASVALLVVLGGGGATVFVMKQRAAAAAAEEAGDEDTATAAHDKAEKDGHRVAPTFVPLDPFVVNLADKDTERYAQVGLTLEVDDPKFAEEMKLFMPAIRNSILMILAHKSAAELLERSGKEALAAEIIREAVRPMGIEIEPEAQPPAQGDADAEPKPKTGKAAKSAKPAVHNPVRRVHFSSFIVQ